MIQTRYFYFLRFILFISDLVIVNLAFFLAFFVVRLEEDVSVSSYKNYWVICNLVWLFACVSVGAYKAETVRYLVNIFRATWRSVAMHFIFFVIYLIAIKDSDYSREFLIVFYVLLCGILFISRFVGTYFEQVLKRNLKIQKTVAVIGMNTTGLRLASYFQKHRSNYNFEGFLDEHESFSVDELGNLQPGLSENIKMAALSGVEEIYVSLAPEKIGAVGMILKEAEEHHIRVKFVPDLSTVLPAAFKVKYMDGFQVLTSRKEPLEEIENRSKKRLFDIFFSLFVIVFVFTWLFPIIIIIQYLTSPGPIFFIQERVGRDDKIFKCYKFRTMEVIKDKPMVYTPVEKGDARITRFGAFMRRTSIDELPQFFNVLSGPMSVVGPRPHAIAFNDMYSTMVEQIKIRHFVKPGITGWAQLNGLRGDVTDPEENKIRTRSRIEHDIWYLENWDFQLDVKIVFLTFWNMITGDKNAR